LDIQHFYEPVTGSITYVVHERGTGVVIDPVRDFEPATGAGNWQGAVNWHSAEAVAKYIDALGLSIAYVIDTHAHADHLSGLPFFRQRYGAKTVTGAGINDIQPLFADPYDDDVSKTFDTFDVLIRGGDVLTAGSLCIEAIATPGHTTNHLCLKIADALFVADTLFMPDCGTARCDFPGGSAAVLYDSIQQIYDYPDEVRLFVGHDYPPTGRTLRWETSVGEQKQHNIHLQADTTKADFIQLREARDSELDMPRLYWQALQVNVQAGELPRPGPNGVVYLKVPLLNTRSEARGAA